IRQHQPLAYLVHNTHRRERSRPHLAAVRKLTPIAHSIPTHVAAGALHADIRLPFRRAELARHFGNHRSLGHLLEALPQDLHALFDLLDADPIAIETIADGAVKT